jgi:aryl-alcohol dehydrogenase-like predicted oxidoreductase
VDQGVGVLAYSPLGEGFLTGKYAIDAIPPPEARVKSRPEVGRYFSDRHFSVLRQVLASAMRIGATPAQVSLAWILGRPAVTSAVIGARRVEQLDDNLAAADLRLSDEDSRALEEASVWTDDRTPLAVM